MLPIPSRQHGKKQLLLHWPSWSYFRLRFIILNSKLTYWIQIREKRHQPQSTKGLFYSKWKGYLFYVHDFVTTGDLVELWFGYKAMIWIWMLVSNGCCMSLYVVILMQLELGIKFASISYGLSSDAGFLIFVLCFWRYSRVASATWKLAQTLCLTISKPKQNHGLANILFSILFLLFPNKSSLPSQMRETWSFLGQKASNGSRGAAGSTERPEQVLHPVLAVALKGTVLLLHFSHKRKIEATNTYKDFRNPKGTLQCLCWTPVESICIALISLPLFK